MAHNLIGREFDRLRVIDVDTEPHSRKHWICECSCGNVCSVSTDKLISKATKSCGCLRSDVSRKNIEGNRRRYEDAGLRMLYADYKANAAKRGYNFEIDLEQFEELTSGDCHYCGIEPEQIRTGRRTYGEYVYNGIDRVDNTKGYEPDNVVSCCKVCNRAKNNMSYDEYMEWIARIVDRHK